MTTSERFSADLAKICFPNGRVVGSVGHADARRILDARLKDLELLPYSGTSFQLPYERHGVTFTNLVATLPGDDRALPPVLIGAHYDSAVEGPSADDNAAAVCIALQAALDLRKTTRDRDVVIALFDAEEPPHFLSDSMGSTCFYEDHRDARGFHAAIVMDLVGHDVSIPIPGGDTLADLLFVTGAESHPEMEALLRARVAADGLRVVASLNRYIGDMSDHHVFRTNDVPYLFLSCGRWEHYHRRTDTVDRLNLAKMERIATWLVSAVNAAADTSFEGEVPGDDFTLKLECETLGRALSTLDPEVLEPFGIQAPKTREQMTEVAQALLRAGL